MPLIHRQLGAMGSKIEHLASASYFIILLGMTSPTQSLMPEEELRQVSWIGEKFVRGPIRAVIVTFHGLGFGGLKYGPGYEEQEWAENGGLVVFPYYGPWSWMNASSRRFVDRLIASVYSHFKLTDEIPLIIAGGSMGGLVSLIYTRYSPHKVAACFALFPVCDLEYHFTERPDLPATLRFAMRDEPGDFHQALQRYSPLHEAKAMPDIPYLIVHGDKDQAVNKEKHSDRFVAEMKKLGKNVKYVEVPGMGHGSDVPYSASRAQIDFIKSFFAR
jgi:dipeptidyl aminopeptidase/acylaminoacyl peptidase